jgi:hypothetical protein
LIPDLILDLTLDFPPDLSLDWYTDLTQDVIDQGLRLDFTYLGT